jgi:hypothetical protein
MHTKVSDAKQYASRGGCNQYACRGGCDQFVTGKLQHGPLCISYLIVLPLDESAGR